MIGPVLVRRAGLGIFAVLVTGCAAIPPPVPLQATEVPAAWSEPISASGNVWPDADWWRRFQSAELDELVAEVRTSNLDLAAAAARILQAQAQTAIARSALFPVVGLGGSVQNSGAVENGSSVNHTTFGLAGQLSYLFDFWGLARNNVRAAAALLRATLYAQETVALIVTSNAASGFFDVLALRERIAIASRNLETAQIVLEGIQMRTTNGLSSPLDLAQQQALVAGQAAVIPALQQRERQALYSLATLLGRAPEGLSIAAPGLAGIVIPEVAPGLSSGLLNRRPDIAQAEANLIAANANLNAARAAFFPVISLTGSAGLASAPVSVVSEGFSAGQVAGAAGPTGLIYGIGVSILQTIFDGGRRQGQLNLARAQQEELIANYRKAVFVAFAEVETALNQAARLAEQERLKAEQVERASTAFDISNVQYREGLIDLFALLQAQQTLFTAQDQLVEIRLARLEAIVALYTALGGGWQDSTEVGP